MIRKGMYVYPDRQGTNEAFKMGKFVNIGGKIAMNDLAALWMKILIISV
jgi:hypothetical protein